MTPKAKLSVLLVLALAALASMAGAAGAAVPDPDADRVPGEVVVRFAAAAPTVARAQALARVDAQGAAAVRGVPRTRVVELPEGRSVDAAVRTLNAEDGVAWAEPNYISRLAAIPDDPRFGDLWGLRNTGQGVGGAPAIPGIDIDVLGAWTRLTAGARVAVVDSGIDPTHPDIAANLRGDLSRNFVPDPNGTVDPADWTDPNGHGTHVAGTIAAVGDNGVGIAGVAWSAELVAVRACGVAGTCTTAALAESYAYAATTGARIVNVSIAGPRSFAERTAIAANPGTLYVVAAGNSGQDVDQTPSYPCSYDLPNVVCVAAIAQDGALASFSNYGPETVDVGAPGTEILSTVPELETPFVDDFAAGLGGWTADPAGSWVATYLDEEGTIDAASLDDELDPLPAQSTLTLDAPFSLAGLTHCALKYSLVLDTVINEQRVLAEVAAGADEWIPVQAPRAGYSGSTGGRIVPIAEPLPEFDGATDVRVRFRVVVSEDTRDRPAIVDVVEPKVVCLGTQPPDGAYSFLQGTSMASPHVAGVAALVAAAHSGAASGQLRSALLDTVAPVPSLVATTTTGGRVDAAAAIAALDPRPPAPPPAPDPQPRPQPQPAAGSAAAFAAARAVRIRPNGRAIVRLRCGTVRAPRCAGRVVLAARVRLGARRGVSKRRIALGARRFRLAKGRTATVAVWLRPRPARLLRAGRIARPQVRVVTRQPAGADVERRSRTRAVRLLEARGGGRTPRAR